MRIEINLTMEQVQEMTRAIDPDNEIYTNTMPSADELSDFVMGLIEKWEVSGAH